MGSIRHSSSHSPWKARGRSSEAAGTTPDARALSDVEEQQESRCGRNGEDHEESAGRWEQGGPGATPCTVAGHRGLSQVWKALQNLTEG